MATNPFRAEAERRATAQLAKADSVTVPRAESMGVAGDMVAGFAHDVDRLIPGQTRGNLRPPDTMSADIGGMIPETLASFVLPATRLIGVAAQGGLAGIASLLRDPDDPLGAAFSTGLAGGATGAGDFAGRTLKGTAQRVVGRIKGEAELIRTKSQALRTLSETLGGSGGFNKRQQAIVNRSWVEALGESGEQVTGAVRRSAAKRIGKVMDDALPTSQVNVQGALSALDEIPADRMIGHKALQGDIGAASRNPKAYQEVMGTLRTKVRGLAGQDDELMQALLKVMDEMGEAGTQAGAANTRTVREQYKNLMLLESIPSVRRTGNVPPISAEGKVFTNYGNTTSRNQGAGTLPATQKAIQTTQEGAAELAARFKSSGTAERMAQTEAAQDVAGVLTGQTSPSRLLRTLGSLAVIGPMAGAAAVANPSPIVARGARFGADALESLLESDNDPKD